MTRIDSRILFENINSDTGEKFMIVDIQWGGVPPLFVDAIGDAMFSSVIPKVQAFRAIAADARAKADAAAPAAPQA